MSTPRPLENATNAAGWVMVCHVCGVQEEFPQPVLKDAVEAAVQADWNFSEPAEICCTCAKAAGK